MNLIKRLKEMRHLFRRNADPGIGNTELHPIAICVALTFHGQCDRSFFGEFDCIAQQVEENLTHFASVGLHHTGIRRTNEVQRILSIARQRLDDPDHFTGNRIHTEGVDLDIHLPLLDLGEIQNVADNRQQVLTG